MAYTYTTEPHPTCKGKLLAIAPKPEHWRCLSDEEHAFLNIGGKHWRGHQRPDSVAYTLSPAQARDLDALLRAGFRPCTHLRPELRDADDPAFWHPEHEGQEYTKAEALELVAQPKRCSRTIEMDLVAPPIPAVADDAPIVGERQPSTREIWREAFRLARASQMRGKALYDLLLPKFGHNAACLLQTMIERGREPDFPSREDRQRAVLNCFGSKNPFRCPSPMPEGWRRTVARVDALVKRLEAAGRIERDAGGYVARVVQPRRPTSEAARTVLRNAAAILQAARRNDGSYSWGPSLSLSVPRRHHLGWWAFTWHDGERQMTVDIERHRSIAKNVARGIIADRSARLPIAA